jgi:hypothetical protein
MLKDNPYAGRPGIREALKRESTVSINLEGTDADYNMLMKSDLSELGDINPEVKGGVYLLAPTSIESEDAVARRYVDYQHQLLESKIKEIMLHATGTHTIGLPMVYAGHWHYLRLSINDGKLTKAALIDSRQKTKVNTQVLTLTALTSVNEDIDFTVENTANQQIGNTCMDWVAVQALRDKGSTSPLVEVEDDAGVRAVTSMLIQRQLNPSYEHVLALLESRLGAAPSVNGYQVRLDTKIATAFQELLQRADVEDTEDVDEAALFAQAKRTVLQQTSIDLGVDKTVAAPTLTNMRARFFQVTQKSENVETEDNALPTPQKRS